MLALPEVVLRFLTVTEKTHMPTAHPWLQLHTQSRPQRIKAIKAIDRCNSTILLIQGEGSS